MNREISESVLHNAQVLWNYHHLDLGLRPVDFILALGSHDERVAEHAARLMLDDYAPLLVTSGGFGKVTKKTWETTEGDRFAEIAKRRGVLESQIIVERTASNTGDNVTCTRDLLQNAGIEQKSGILVTKPYMRRRAFATASKQWPEIDWLISSPSLSFEEYPDADVPQDRMIDLMVGDLQRIKVYAKTGFQIPQEIPDNIWHAYEELVESGFDTFVINSET